MRFRLPLPYLSPDPPASAAAPAPADPSPPPVTHAPIACQFCGCSLAANGRALDVSDKAQMFIDQAQRIRALESDLAAAHAERDRLRQQVAELTPKPAARRFGL